MEARQHQARRVVEYHQNHIADHLIRCERGEGHDKPFRHTLSTSVDPPRRRRDHDQDFLVETHVPPRPGPLSVKPRMVKPLVRLRRPGGLGGSSERSSTLGHSCGVLFRIDASGSTKGRHDRIKFAGKFYLESILNSFLEASEKIGEAQDEVFGLLGHMSLVFGLVLNM
eukprot:symbB.v1.2.038776.t1/scaffold6152.1/size20496/1